MKKIMPNDKCSCKSGKKYKFCCLNRKQFLIALKNFTGGEYIDTNYVLSEVTGHSEIMRKYLESILPSIDRSIVFAVNPNLNANMRTGGIEDTNISIIIVKRVPISEDDYFDLAHEFGHILTYEKGYTATSTKNVDMAMGTVLTNTIMDPMINQMLYSYGFDFITYLKKGFSIQIPLLKGYPIEAKLDLFFRHYIKCLIIEKELEWEIIDESILANEFKKVYKDKYPLLYKEAVEFIEYAKTKGMDTPEEVKAVLSKLRSDNKMEQYIELR